MRFTTMILMLAGTSVTAEVDIHRCLLADGTIAFQEMPCPEPEAVADDDSEAGESLDESEAPPVDDDVFDFVNPFDEPPGPQIPAEETLSEQLSGDRAECERTTRDAIDAIDLEMRQESYSNEEGQDYLAELLALTRQLRACKRL